MSMVDGQKLYIDQLGPERQDHWRLFTNVTFKAIKSLANQ